MGLDWNFSRVSADAQKEYGIDRHVQVIVGQELDSKTEHLALAARGKCAPGWVLLISDAPAYMSAARANGALFYLFNPGVEEESRQRFLREGMKRFLEGSLAGSYEKELTAEFK